MSTAMPSISDNISSSTSKPNGARKQSTQAGPYGPFGPAFQIIPGVQNYDWGITGRDGSLVAVYGEATEQLKITVQQDKPYAELWMGTHPTLPSTIVPPPGSSQSSSNGESSSGSSSSSSISSSGSDSFMSLSSYLNQHSALLGEKVVEKYGTGLTKGGPGNTKDQGALPFLFKILSAGKALSIQAHPDKELAKKLHKEKPKSYKDDNHKPEMAVALTEFSGFCGFRPLREIVHFLQVVPEFQALVRPTQAFLSEVVSAAKETSGTSEEETKTSLKKIFEPLMKAAVSDVKTQTIGIAQRYADKLGAGQAGGLEVSEELAKLVCTLNEQFPGDVGIFCSFMLNVVHLQPGQAMFLGADEPHAYISGQIVECMAASDNVVRAGLTPKERDVDVLVDMLTYSSAGPDKQLMKPRAFLPIKESSNYSVYERVIAANGGSDELALDTASPSAAERGDDAAALPSLLYDPPIEEFSVVMTRLGHGQSEIQRPIDGPSILILTTGKGTLKASWTDSDIGDGEQSRYLTMDKAGKVYFVGAGTKVELSAAVDLGEGEKLTMFRAYVEV